MTRPGAPLHHLLNRAFEHARVPSTETGDPTDARILDAAVRVLADRGTEEATMDEVAAQAGIGRSTLFRRFQSKDHLFERALSRDITRVLTDLAVDFTVITDPTDQVVHGFRAAVGLRDHPLLRGATPTRRLEVIEGLSHGPNSAVALAFRAIRANIARAQQSGRIPSRDADAQADVLIHAAISYIVAPSLGIDLDDPDAAERIARAALAPVITGTTPDPAASR
ncbi:TetR/AcrR family transcriptional regulator [Gordonia sp. HY285]|uniref:TetR/AcrR family transcriptional regulator n=1 Tax=Gordonia liuliyuniae TaxID=2911517 RepID=UPI001F32FD2C|nr:TetR/AcrR family transcriptional regulator [Gordonia liuliyuniae]MCF8609065.1 TetR/AcrR family transcriptional regulator [Gordonia liuliyuniae]